MYGDVGICRMHVRKLFAFTDVHLYVLSFSVQANNHSFVHRDSRTYKCLAALLHGFERIGRRHPGFERNEYAISELLDMSLYREIADDSRGKKAGAAGGCEHITPKSQQIFTGNLV